MKKNCIVAQSGGPTVAINSAVAGVIKGVLDSAYYDKIYGSIHGIQGVLRNRFLDLSASDDEFIDNLCKSPAMYLGSCRFKLPDYSEDASLYAEIFKVFEGMNIGAFFYVGGNDSMDTVDKLSAYAASIGSDIKIAGIPKTIDNDLELTDHTPGFGSAAKYVAASIREIAYDTYIYDVKSVAIVEIMGRDAGWLTAASALARTEFSAAPHLIYLPERSFDSEQFIEDVRRMLDIHKNVIVAVSEGIHDKDGNYICAGTATEDKFGHAQLSGTGKVLEQLIKDRLGVKVRSIEINVLQRAAAHLAAAQDLKESFMLGKKAVEYTSDGKTGFMTIVKCDRSSEYSFIIDCVPVSEVANKAKPVPDYMINPEGNDVTDAMLDYAKPLIQGEVATNYVDGLPSYPDISHLTHKSQC